MPGDSFSLNLRRFLLKENQSPGESPTAASVSPADHNGVDLKGLVDKILDEVTLCSMATVRPDGKAHINTAYFWVDDALRLFFASRPETTHVRNLGDNPSMALTVFSTGQEWDDDKRGLQLFGEAFSAEGADGRLAEELYAKRFPDYAKWLREADPADLEKFTPSFFVFVPDEIKILSEGDLGEEEFVTARVERS